MIKIKGSWEKGTEGESKSKTCREGIRGGRNAYFHGGPTGWAVGPSALEITNWRGRGD